MTRYVRQSIKMHRICHNQEHLCIKEQAYLALHSQRSTDSCGTFILLQQIIKKMASPVTCLSHLLSMISEDNSAGSYTDTLCARDQVRCQASSAHTFFPLASDEHFWLCACDAGYSSTSVSTALWTK